MSKKVFFLYPHSVIQQKLIQELIENEYSVYAVTDHMKLRKIIGDYNEPILFINIDEELSADEWNDYIAELMEADDNTAMIGVLTYNEDKKLAEKYLMELSIPCGYITLKLGYEQSRDILLKMLVANEARGRRKYIRVNCMSHSNTGFNVRIRGEIAEGRIRDISSVGMAFMFKDDPGLNTHSVVSDIQLKLKGKIARVSGPIMGSRIEDESKVYVLLFDKNTGADMRGRIHSYIYEMLQEEINLKISEA